MKVTEIQNNDIQLSIPKFTCDTTLGDHIKEPLPKTSFFMIISGKPASGKTSLAVSLLTSKAKNRVYRKCFDHIIIFMPKHSLNSMKKNPFKGLPKDQKFTKLTANNLMTVKKMVKDWSDDDERTLIFVDDMTAYLKDNSLVKLWLDLVNNRRHYHISLMMMVQNYKTVPLHLRKVASHLIFYKSQNKAEIESIRQECVYRDKNDFNKILKFTWRKKHDFLLCNMLTGELYRNFNKLVIED